MFSGIIEEKVRASKFEKTVDGLRLTLPKPKKWELQLGESVNVDGVCSTVESLEKSNFTVFYMPETLSRTTLSSVKADHMFNLEKSLTLNSLVGGHLVSGHVDATANVSNIEFEDESRVLTFKISKELTKYIVYKGSICVNGVSLTIVSVSKNEFKVSLIPYTLKATNLGELKINDMVNIEVDLLAKYIEKLIKKS